MEATVSEDGGFLSFFRPKSAASAVKMDAEFQQQPSNPRNDSMKNCAQIVAAMMPAALNVNHQPRAAAEAVFDKTVRKVYVKSPFNTRGWYPTALRVAPTAETTAGSLEEAFLRVLDGIAERVEEMSEKMMLALIDGENNVAMAFLFAPQVESDDKEEVAEAWKRGPFISLSAVAKDDPASTDVPELRGMGDWLYWVTRNPALMIRNTLGEQTLIWGKSRALSVAGAAESR